MIHQYYYHNNECKADSVESKNCICWHDEGTGPFVNERHDHKNCHPHPRTRNLQWRVKPDELAAANERIKRLEEAGDALKAAGYFGGWADAVNKWIKVREDKP